MDVNHQHDMPRVSPTCCSCENIDLPSIIMRSGLSDDDLWHMSMIYTRIEREEGGCSSCNKLTKLLWTSFGDEKTENFPKYCHLEIHHVSHPVHNEYKAAYFSLGPDDSENNRWRYLLPMHAQFFGSQSSEHAYLPCARAVDSCTVDYDMFNDCIKLCESEHSATCGSTFARGFKPTRLIDCQTNTLCAASNNQYVCLSYVWGDVPADDATSNNQTLTNIPQTVLDAMFVTLRLGMRYLWVDRYCIDQDNPQEKHEAIRNMDLIYRNAFVTIIAAAGSGSDYGLPGVSRPRKVTPSVNIEGHAFMVVQDPLTDMEASTWNTRGWTYQEMLLSRRRLIFTDRQVYLQCQTHQTMEQLNRDIESTDLIKRIARCRQFLPAQKQSFTINDIYSRLEEYYVRTLRYETDNINAFAGVFRDLSGRTSSDDVSNYPSLPGLYMPRSNPHFYGIPLWLQGPERIDDDDDLLWWQSPKVSNHDMASLRFGLNLGWCVREGIKVSPSTHNEAIVKPDFPSWSWASVKGQRLKHGQCRLFISGRPHALYEMVDANFSASVTHRSGERMSMLAYTAQQDDYTLFHPWIDVVAYTISGHLQRGEHYPYIFSALPHATVCLDSDQEHMVGQLRALYIGMFTEGSPCGLICVALFLLLEESGKHEFRRIGLCTMNDGGQRNRSGKPFGIEEGFHQSPSHPSGQQEKSEAPVKWKREELRII